MPKESLHAYIKFLANALLLQHAWGRWDPCNLVTEMPWRPWQISLWNGLFNVLAIMRRIWSYLFHFVCGLLLKSVTQSKPRGLGLKLVSQALLHNAAGHRPVWEFGRDVNFSVCSVSGVMQCISTQSSCLSTKPVTTTHIRKTQTWRRIKFDRMISATKKASSILFQITLWSVHAVFEKNKAPCLCRSSRIQGLGFSTVASWTVLYFQDDEIQ